MVGTRWEIMPKETNKVDGAEVPSQAYRVDNGAETRSPPCMKVVSRFAYVQIEIRRHLGRRRLNQGNDTDGQGCEASQLQRNDKGDPFGDSTDIVKVEWTTS